MIWGHGEKGGGMLREFPALGSATVEGKDHLQMRRGSDF